MLKAVMAAALLAFIALTLVFGRVFCGYLCPIGAVQELAYRVPTRKPRVRDRRVALIVHWAAFALMLVLGLAFSIKLLGFFGVASFFQGRVKAAFFYVFLALLALGVFIYRPFCRYVCPYGALLSLAASKSLFKLRRRPSCVKCRSCERACPAHEAYEGSSKQECYLCLRCVDACRPGALEYART